MSKWIEFVEGPPKPRTKTWAVMTKETGDTIARIYWYGPWRRYVVEPKPFSVYEQDCLRDIATFIEAETLAQRAASKIKESP